MNRFIIFMLTAVVAAGGMTAATTVGKTFRLITSEDQLVPGAEYVLVADYPVDTYKDGQKLHSASTDLMSCTAYTPSDNQSMHLLTPSAGYTFVDDTKQKIVVTDNSAILTLEGSKGKWQWGAITVEASGKESYGYLQSGATAADTYHNLTVTQFSLGFRIPDSVYERTLTNVTFFPTEDYYINDQKHTATNTVHITFTAHSTEEATGRELSIRQDGTHHFGIYAWADKLMTSNLTDNCPVHLYGIEETTLEDIAKKSSEYGGDIFGVYAVTGTDLQAITAVRDHEFGEDMERYYVLVKDGNGNSVEKVQHNAGLFDYRVNGRNQDNYDQSNWVLVEVTKADYLAFNKKNHKVTSIVGGNFNASDVDPIIEAVSVYDSNNTRIYPVINYGEAGDDYVPNTYCAVNFMTSYTDDFTGNSIAAGANAAKPGNYFFVNPKPQEYCSAVWAVWDAENWAFYVPAHDGNNNREDFDGGFIINLAYNEGDIQDKKDLVDQKMYNFTAIVKKSMQMAPRHRVNANTKVTSDQYTVYPLELNKGSVVTSVSDVQAPKTVQHVGYYNLAGIETSEPQAGLNIVVTTYTDGTTQTAKVMK